MFVSVQPNLKSKTEYSIDIAASVKSSIFYYEPLKYIVGV